MHLAIGLDIRASTDRKNEIAKNIKDVVFKKNKFAKRLGNFYIIKINSNEEANIILDALTSFANEQAETINFIMTPVMTGGRYNGLLKKGSWDFINEITDENEL